MVLDVDNKYNDLYGDENIIKESEKLPNKIKYSLEKGKLIKNQWKDNNKLSSIINDCINIEDNIKNINLINDNIKKCKINNNSNIELFLEDENYKDFIKSIKSLGYINDSYKLTKIDSLI